MPPHPDPSDLTRRTVLKGAAVAGGAVTAAPMLSAGSVAAAAPATQQDLARQHIKHVVFLMMENRSFDHLFGCLSGVRGFDDRSVTRPDGGDIFAQWNPKTKRRELPYRLSEINNLPGGDADLSHNWGPQHISLNGGRNDSWITSHLAADGANGVYTMGYLTRADAPYHYAMADAFTVQDNYFCSVLGPTYPNRLMWQMGSIDPDGTGGGPLLTTDESVFTDNGGQGVFTFRTYPELLTKAGVTWRAYTEPASNHLLNMFPAFKQYNAGATSDPTNVLNGTVGTTTGGFLADINAGTLPQVSWIFPSVQSTEHPGDGPINAGPQFYEPIITALMASPSWDSTALFITWDENDGYFDHVPPPTPPKGTPLEFLTHAAFGFDDSSANPQAGTVNPKDPSEGIKGPVGLGFRVPNIVISPWSTGGRVNSEVSDHTSCLKLVETLFGVPLKGQGIISDWRYDLVSDLTGCFDFATAAPSGPPPAALQSAFVASQALFATHNSGDETPPAVQVMPKQETTPARPRVGPVPAYLRTPAPTRTKPTTTKPNKRTAKHPTAKPAAHVTGPAGSLAATGGLPAAGAAVALVAAGAVVAKARAHPYDDPSTVMSDGTQGAMRSVTRKRIARGGASDATQAGGHLPKWVEPTEEPSEEP
ncbi:MAG TPA: alkaline phosphatase family protein [Mycobacteriales bacterium]|nr:alkaline phosphatase family protein [Mycobacteriales bacterium]